AIWKAWDDFKPQLQALCPWAEAPSTAPPARPRSAGGANNNVIGAFNAAHDLRALLVDNGYEKRGKRYLAPTSSTGLAGVVVFEDGAHCYSHHASDPLNDGTRHDAFDLYCRFEHGGNVERAVRAAAEALHMETLPEVPAVDPARLIEAAKRRQVDKEQRAAFTRPLPTSHEVTDE